MSVTKHTTTNTVTVDYPSRPAQLDITHAEHALILAFSTEKVKMIKFIRAQYNLGLYEAKQVIDTVIASAESASAEATEPYWGTLPRGGMILVRDDEIHDWKKRVFISYDEGTFYRYVCKEEDGSNLKWKYAKLITD